ncbi:MAG: LysR family transcriptional regulator [Blastomonas sp.]
MDTRFLESFVVAVDCTSIAQAARRLNISPAALAKRIQALEVEIGVRLLARAGRTARPTEAGYAIYESAKKILRDTRGLKQMAQADILPGGQLRIGVIGTAVTGVLPTILDHLAQAYPQLDLYIVPGTSFDLYRRLIDRDLDAAIVVEPPFDLGKEFDWMLLRDEPLMLISPHTLTVTQANATRVLRSEPFIRYDRQHWGGRLADAYLQQAEIRPRERFELDALDAIAVLVDRGLGVSLVPDWAPPWPEGLKLNKVRIAGDAFVRRIGLLWLRNAPSARLVKAFRLQARMALDL